MFQYRIAYGCWLNDSRLLPIPDEDWPSVRIDEDTLSSLGQTAAFLRQAGYNYLDVFGLITNQNWEPKIEDTVSQERMEKVREVISIFHQEGLKVIYGLGVYSWGFERLISLNAAVRGTSSQVMCASAPESEEVMRSIVDYLMQHYDLDGFHLEAADQGRCRCERCAEIPDDIDYYNHINHLVASYIRSKWPDRLLLVNTSGYLAWGDRFSQAQLEQMIGLSEVVDVFIDVGSHGHFVEDQDRPDVIRRMKASFGTANGFWIYPPQRWDRERWFLPHFLANYEHLKKLHQDGGRSCELYLSPISNPGAEMTQMCNGIFLNQPDLLPQEIMREAIKRLYQPRSKPQEDVILEVFVEAENLFFDSWQQTRKRDLPEALSDGVETVFQWSDKNPGKAVPGELFLEPLWGVGPGFPCYLTVHFDREGREKYRAGIAALKERILALPDDLSHPVLTRISRCLTQVIQDIHTANLAMEEAGPAK